jgi:serine/threonine protein kinase
MTRPDRESPGGATTCLWRIDFPSRGVAHLSLSAGRPGQNTKMARNPTKARPERRHLPRALGPGLDRSLPDPEGARPGRPGRRLSRRRHAAPPQGVLKVLTGPGPGSDDSVHRLRREAEVASKLQQRGICGVHDAGVANGTPYIAMHYVEGKTLAEGISETKTKATAGEPTTTKQEIPETLRVFEKAAVALHAPHEAGIVHRDIKPGNIMVSATGQPVILDFGLTLEARPQAAVTLATLFEGFARLLRSV